MPATMARRPETCGPARKATRNAARTNRKQAGLELAVHAADQNGKRITGVLESAQRRPLTRGPGNCADQHDHPDIAQDRRDPGDDQPGHVQVQGRPGCSGQHESVDGQGSPPVLPVVQDRVVVMQDSNTRGLEVIHKIVRLSAVGEDQHRQAQHQGGGDRYHQRGPPVAALRNHHERHADREKQQRGRAPMGGELIVGHAATSTRAISRRGHMRSKLSFPRTDTTQWNRPTTAPPVRLISALTA